LFRLPFRVPTIRHWKTLSTSFATLGARLSSVAGLLIINGVAKRHMTGDQFGLWSILYSINLFTNGLDFGFRFTLGNRLAALGSRGAEAEEERRETFLAIFFQQAAIGVVLMLLVLLVFPLFPWAQWFKIHDPQLAAEVHQMMPPLTAIMIATLPFALIWTVFFAYLEIKRASLLTGIVTFFQTGIFIFSVYRFSFTWVVTIYFLSNIGFGMLLTGYVFIRRKWKFTLLPLNRIGATVRSMIRISFPAFLFGQSATVSMILGPIVSGATSGLNAAGDFALIQKLFSPLVTAHLAMLAPISPAITMESHAGNWNAVRSRLRVCVLQLWPAVFIGLGVIIWGLHPVLIRLWAGIWLKHYPLAGLLLIWACLNGFVNTFAVFLNSLGLVKMQAVVSNAMIIPSLLLPVYLQHLFGVPGIALSMVVCTIPGAIIWPLYTRRALRLHMLHV